jgi:asparagine synthase (glutamine-hydrolysing)
VCGIAGAIDLSRRSIPDLRRRLDIMNELQAHRGPDGHATWRHDAEHVGFAHRRLSIIDLTTGDQPITDGAGSWISYNGEVYNYIELRAELGGKGFRTTSDTEVVLRAYQEWGNDSVKKLRGMFAFSLWDARTDTLFCARDRFGIKPFYYAQVDRVLYFASEIKALLPFLPSVETDLEGLKDYLCFQFCLGGKTLFKGVKELLPGHWLMVRDGKVTISRYWRFTTSPTSTTRRCTSRTRSVS